jgi:hypothetical protein
MVLEFAGEIFLWRGPSPYFFVTVPDEPSAALESASPTVSYGWGCIPVTAHLGETTWRTSLFPKDDRYLVPLKVAVRKAEGVDLGDVVRIRLDVTI